MSTKTKRKKLQREESLSENDPIQTEEAEQSSKEHVSPKQRAQKRRKNFTATDKNVEQTNSIETPNKRPHIERTVDRVLRLRKRANCHEYLVKWANSADEEWIDRDVMITKYPQRVIDYFQSVITFKDQPN